jgi:archaellum biogenesis protein FlaJ (TadC family)
MKWLIDYDAWFFHRVEGLLKWLDEWLSISQKYAERGMIALYLVLTLPPAKWTLSLVLVKIICALSLGTLMWMLHKRPAAVRKYTQRSRFEAVNRIILQGVFGVILVAVLFAPPYQWTDVPTALAQVVYVVFFYATDITSDGERGRRRKAALAELKKMFGTEWIPKPLLVPR